MPLRRSVALQIMPFLVLACGVLASPLLAATPLQYGGAVGQVAEYRLLMKVTGNQVSLGERRPVRAEMEWRIREEVLARDPDGALTLAITGRLTQLKNPTDAFSDRAPTLSPIRLRQLPTGEVMLPVPEMEVTGGMDDALASLLTLPAFVVMPTGPAEVGFRWQWEKDGASQENALLALNPTRGRARITSTGRTPLTLISRSRALGLSTRLTGIETQTSTLDLLLDPGLPLRHQGKGALQANTEVALESPAGSHRFFLELGAEMEFDLRLIRLNGVPVAPDGEGEADGAAVVPASRLSPAATRRGRE